MPYWLGRNTDRMEGPNSIRRNAKICKPGPFDIKDGHGKHTANPQSGVTG